MKTPRDLNRLGGSFAGLCLAVVVGIAGYLAAQERRSALPRFAAAAEVPAPFRAGETLDYRVQWLKLLNAATLRLAVTERRPFYGREAWHFQAQARTVDLMRLLYALDDQFDSYSDLGALVGLQFEMYLREQGKQEDSVYRMSTEGDPRPGPGATVRVLPGTRDPIGFLYYLRTVDWERTRDVHSPVFDGRKLYEVHARVAQPRVEVEVAAGRYVTSQIEIRVFERGRELPQTHFSVWFARNAGRTPVLVEAEVPFGTARVELSRADWLR